MKKKPQFDAPAFTLESVQRTEAEIMSNVRCASHAEAISDILPHLCLGSWRDAENLATIRAKGITHILNVAKELPPASEIAAMDAVSGVVKKHIPLVDAHSQDILSHFEAAFDFIDSAKASGGRVLVHCRRGISRSPAIIVGYLMTHYKHSFESALAFLKERRSSVSLNLAFRTVLEEYKPLPPKACRKSSPLPVADGVGNHQKVLGIGSSTDTSDSESGPSVGASAAMVADPGNAAGCTTQVVDSSFTSQEDAAQPKEAPRLPVSEEKT